MFSVRCFCQVNTKIEFTNVARLHIIGFHENLSRCFRVISCGLMHERTNRLDETKSVFATLKTFVDEELLQP